MKIRIIAILAVVFFVSLSGALSAHAQYYTYPYSYGYPYGNYPYGNGNIYYGNSVIYNYWGNGPVSSQTLPASAIAATSAVLNGAVSANDPLARYQFQYGTTPTLGAETGFFSIPVNTQTSVSYPLANLAPHTAYFFRIIAQNNFGNGTSGQILSFTTGSGSSNVSPVVARSVSDGQSGQFAATSAADPIGAQSATLHGTVNPNGVSTSYYFEYGVSPDLDQSTIEKSVGAGTAAVSVSMNIYNLTPGTTYYYRVGTESEKGVAVGSILSFTTRTAASSNAGQSASAADTASATKSGSAPAITDAYTPVNSYGAGARFLAIFGAHPSPCFTLSGTISSKTVSPGGAVRYAVSGKNNCQTDFTNSVLRIMIPEISKLTSSTSPYSNASGNVYQYDLGDFPRLSTLSVTVASVMDSAAADATPINFAATVDFNDSGARQTVETMSSGEISTPFLASIFNMFRSRANQTSNISGSGSGGNSTLTFFNIVLVAAVIGFVAWIVSRNKKTNWFARFMPNR